MYMYIWDSPIYRAPYMGSPLSGESSMYGSTIYALPLYRVLGSCLSKMVCERRSGTNSNRPSGNLGVLGGVGGRLTSLSRACLRVCMRLYCCPCVWLSVCMCLVCLVFAYVCVSVCLYLIVCLLATFYACLPSCLHGCLLACLCQCRAACVYACELCGCVWRFV